MKEPPSNFNPVFCTPWFEVLETRLPDNQPYYALHTPDFAAVVALDDQGRLLLVRQYRTAVAGFTLELPAGHIETGETPEQAARKELLEETGYEADNFQLLASLSPSTGRFTSRMWCFFSPGARPTKAAPSCREAGVDLVLYGGSLRELFAHPEFYSAGTCAALFAALVQDKLNAEASPGLFVS